jgi:hypothetical protein
VRANTTLRTTATYRMALRDALLLLYARTHAKYATDHCSPF